MIPKEDFKRVSEKIVEIVMDGKPPEVTLALIKSVDRCKEEESEEGRISCLVSMLVEPQFRDKIPTMLREKIAKNPKEVIKKFDELSKKIRDFDYYETPRLLAMGAGHRHVREEFNKKIKEPFLREILG
ncbi:MAG TPA: hypothetical protein ENG66_00015 [Thermococcus sp.]|nr:hypothetical protein [Thermococcus sp.]